MLSFALRRLILTVPVLVGVTLLVFLMVHATPGDPVQLLLGQEYSEEVAALRRQQLGLDRPLAVQYGRWLWNAVRGDLGRSLARPDPVADTIASRLPVTMTLAGLSILLSLVIAIPLGVASATFKDRLIDHASRFLSLLGLSVPVFWLGLILMVVFSRDLGWLPVSGNVDRFGPKALILPTVTLGASLAGLVTRMVRSSMLEVLDADFVRTARSKGLAEGIVIYRHALKCALIPVVTVVGMQFGGLLSGAVLTETVFNMAGFGRLFIEAIGSRDFPLIQGCILVTTLIFVGVNLLVDFAYAALDPRIRYA